MEHEITHEPIPVFKRWGLWCLLAILFAGGCFALAFSLEAATQKNVQLEARLDELTQAEAQLQAEAEAARAEADALALDIARMRQEHKEYTFRMREIQSHLANSLIFYYSCIGTLDYDETYYHRYGSNCPRWDGFEQIAYVPMQKSANIASMPRDSKACPYCYSSSEDGKLNGTLDQIMDYIMEQGNEMREDRLEWISRLPDVCVKTTIN